MKRNEVKDAMFTAVALQIGIFPHLERVDTTNVDGLLTGVPAEQARAMKRKFRKLWRKHAKRQDGRARKELGLGCSTPTKKNKKNRRLLVHGVVSRHASKIIGDQK